MEPEARQGVRHGRQLMGETRQGNSSHWQQVPQVAWRELEKRQEQHHSKQDKTSDDQERNAQLAELIFRVASCSMVCLCDWGSGRLCCSRNSGLCVLTEKTINQFPDLPISIQLD